MSDTKDSQATAQPADLPDWLREAEMKNEPAPSVESLGASAQEQDDAVAWLESLAAKHGAKPEELVTDPNKRSETPPDWVAQAQSINQQPAAQQPNVEDLGASAQEQDDAVAWLESLAAKHGAKPEELVTDPNKRSETPPDWVQQAQSIGEVQSAEKPEWSEGAQNIGEQFFAEFENASKPEPEPVTDETGMWLRDLDDKEKQEDQPLQRGDIPEWLSDTRQSADAAGDKFGFPESKEAAPASDLPNWLSGIDEGAPAEGGDYVSENLSNQDLSDWLSGLDNEPGLNMDPELIHASARPPFPSQPEKPVEVQPANSGLPDWLSGVDSQTESEDDAWKESIEPAVAASTPTEENVPVSLTADLPDWLKGVDEEAAEAGQIAEEDAPPWLHREHYEAEALQQPKPTSPSDWHPLEPKPEAVAQQKQSLVATTPSSQAMAQPIMKYPPSPEPSEQPRVKKKKPARAARPAKVEGPTNANALIQAKGELDRGDIPTALDHYGKLIKKGKHLEETIRDLTESIYRYPVEVGIWQTLGDAYMRANRLKEALESYNKAEELIR